MRDRPNQFPSCIFILDVRTKPSHSTGTIFECVLSKFKMVISIADIPGLGSSHKSTFHARHHTSTRGRFYSSSIMFIVNWISFPPIFKKVTLNIWPNLSQLTYSLEHKIKTCRKASYPYELWALRAGTCVNAGKGPYTFFFKQHFDLACQRKHRYKNNLNGSILLQHASFIILVCAVSLIVAVNATYCSRH